MRLYQLGKLGNLDALKLTEAPEPRPGPGQVVVRIRACSLNHRDLNIVSGGYTSHALQARRDSALRRRGRGYRSGTGRHPLESRRPRRADLRAALAGRRACCSSTCPRRWAGPSDGVLAEQIVLSEEGLVRIPVASQLRAGGNSALRRGHGVERRDGKGCAPAGPDAGDARHRRRVALRRPVRVDDRRARHRHDRNRREDRAPALRWEYPT